MSGKYRLLRDNKESGPYSLDDIKALGLKKYDLIWVEGKSAAWRYPCEVEEFKSFAPQVDEQPYDRFFKKTSQPEHIQLQVAEEKKAATEEQPKIESLTGKKTPEVKKISPKKYVSISLPGTYRVNIAPVKVDPKPAPAQKSQEMASQKEEKPPLEPIFPVKVAVKKDDPQPATVVQMMPRYDMPASVPDRRHWTTNDLIQYAALGMGLFTILMIGYLLVSGYGDPVLTVPASSSPASVVKKTDPRPVTPPDAGSLPDAAAPDKSSNHKEPTTDAVPADQGLEPMSTLPVKKTTVVRFNNDQSKSTETRSPVVTSLSSSVDVSLNKYKVGMFGGIDDIRISLHNRSAYKLDLVVVELQYIQNNNKVFKTETMRFKAVDAGADQELKAPATSRGIKLKTRISYITSSAAGVSENL